MMQFTETPSRPLHQITPFSIPTMNTNNQIHQARPWPGFPTSKGLASFGDANCMEQLLVHCANAIESNDATLAQQILWLANFVDLTPWHRFGFTAANAAILEAVEGYSIIHIVDLSTTHCMQIPTLIDAIANRLEGPPMVKLTVPGVSKYLPPMLDLTYEELGSKLVNFARSRNVMLEFRIVPSTHADGFASLIDQLRLQHLVYAETGEALVINCHMMLHYIPEETLSPSPNANSIPYTLRSAFNYLWIPYDTMETFLPKGSKQRQWYEADICWKIENVIAREDLQRVERVESKSRWVQRMRNAEFRGISFGEEAVSEVKTMLDEHAAGWGLKKEEDDVFLLGKAIMLYLPLPGCLLNLASGLAVGRHRCCNTRIDEISVPSAVNNIQSSRLC
ncbi:putative scarecrow-like protein 16 [Hibiscus syriacus]|uniref:Scarecrow-like protein 16 n=1 Tax=Hibiscus syriacus TaxID=106335 RepID=A0A6A3AAC3_HIBSY|nr:putative scarecrow-like protein 16 [Hibiscus syriacus]